MSDTVTIVYVGPYPSVDVQDWTVPGEHWIVFEHGQPVTVPALLANGGYPTHLPLEDGEPIGCLYGGLLDQPDNFQPAPAPKRAKSEE